MSHASLADLALAIPPETLLRLSADDPMASAADVAVLTDLLEAASADIDAALSSGGQVLDAAQPVPKFIKHLCVSLARCRLYIRRPEGMDMPVAVQHACETAHKMLLALASGKMRLAGQVGSGTDSGSGAHGAVQFEAPPRVFTGGEF